MWGCLGCFLDSCQCLFRDSSYHEDSNLLQESLWHMVCLRRVRLWDAIWRLLISFRHCFEISVSCGCCLAVASVLQQLEILAKAKRRVMKLEMRR